jgi:hypothetical protein
MGNVTEYRFMIGTMDDFESLQDLREYFGGDGDGDGTTVYEPGDLNASIFDFSLPSEDPWQNIAVDVGRGIAFANDWSADHTFSTLEVLSPDRGWLLVEED